jgi:TolB-like protein
VPLLAVALGVAALVGPLVGRWTADGPGPEPAAPAGDGAAAFADRPSLVVLPLANLSGDAGRDHVARGLAEEILINLTRFKDLVVFGRDTGFRYDAAADVRRIGRDLGARFVLRGSLRSSPDRIRVTGELVDAATGATLWAESYDRDLTTADILAIQEDVARRVAAAVAQPYGIIFREDSRRTALRPPESLDAYECGLRFYAYRADVGPEAHAAVRACLERAVAREPGYAAGWAMLAVLYLDEDRYLFNRRPDGPPPLDRALEAAGRAAELGPDDARVQQALMLVHFFRGEPDEALAAGERALALNPTDTELMGEFGGRLVLLSERRERGEALIREALARNPGQAGFYHGMLALALYLDGRYAGAADEIRRANQPDFHLVQAIAAMIYGQLGRREEARAAGRRFVELHPTFVANIGAELRKRNLGPEDRAHILDGLRKAGVPIPEGALDDPAKRGNEASAS